MAKSRRKTSDNDVNMKNYPRKRKKLMPSATKSNCRSHQLNKRFRLPKGELHSLSYIFGIGCYPFQGCIRHMIVFASLEYGQQISHRLKRFINSMYFISYYIIFLLILITLLHLLPYSYNKMTTCNCTSARPKNVDFQRVRTLTKNPAL